MKFTKFVAVTLGAALILTGCGAKKDTKTYPKEAAMTVGDEKVSNGVFGYFFSGYNSQMDDVDKAKEKAIEECQAGYERIAVAKAMNVEIDKSAVDNQMAQVKSSQGEHYEDFLSSNGLSEEDVRTIISMGLYVEALKDKMEMPEITEDMKKDYFKENFRRAKHVLIMIDNDTDDETAKAKAEEVLEKAKSGENFDSLVATYGEDPGMKENSDGYVFTDGTMVQPFQDGVDSIKPGEFTMVKTTYGYHVIERLDLEESPEYFEKAYEENSQGLDSAVSNSLFEEQLKKLVKEYNIETNTNDSVIDEIVKNLTAEDK